MKGMRKPWLYSSWVCQATNSVEASLANATARIAATNATNPQKITRSLPATVEPTEIEVAKTCPRKHKTAGTIMGNCKFYITTISPIHLPVMMRWLQYSLQAKKPDQ